MRRLSRSSKLIQQAYKQHKRQIDSLFPNGYTEMGKKYSSYQTFKKFVEDQKQRKNTNTMRNFTTKEAIKKVLWTEKYLSREDRLKRNEMSMLRRNKFAPDILKEHSGYKRLNWKLLKYDNKSDGYVFGNTLILPIDPSKGILAIVNLITMREYVISPDPNSDDISAFYVYEQEYLGERPDFWKEYKPRNYIRKHRTTKRRHK